MIFDAMYKQGMILESAMKATEYRNEVILNNITNSDTPGYKSRKVEFESILDDAIKSSKSTGKFNPDSVVPKLSTQHSNFSARIDKNNVDIEIEMANFYKNSSRYDAMVNSVLNNSGRMNAVLGSTR